MSLLEVTGLHVKPTDDAARHATYYELTREAIALACSENKPVILELPRPGPGLNVTINIANIVSHLFCEAKDAQIGELK